MRAKSLIITASLALVLCACGSKEEVAPVVETTVEETTVIEETTEESTVETEEPTSEVEIISKYTNTEADVFVAADETSEVLESVGVNHAFSVIGVSDAFSEVIYNGESAYVKSEYLSDTMIEIVEESTVEEVVEETTEPVAEVVEPAPAPVEGGQTQAQKDAFKALEEAGIHLYQGSYQPQDPVGDGHGDLHGKQIILH